MAEIKKTGVGQGDLVQFQENIRDFCNDVKAMLDALLTKMDSDGGIGDADYSTILSSSGSGTDHVPSTDLTLIV